MARQGGARAGRQAPGADPTDAAEVWFRRAIQADPDNRAACQQKLLAIVSEGRSAGRRAIQFGHECLQTENWRGGIPYFLVDAHWLLAGLSEDTKEYLEQPQVWADIKAVFEGALVNYPADALRRSQYAQFAARCGHWDVARQQLDILGDKADLTVFGSKASLEYLRTKANRLSPRGARP